jgi:xanthine phosphoribosyltransferase
VGKPAAIFPVSCQAKGCQSAHFITCAARLSEPGCLFSGGNFLFFLFQGGKMSEQANLQTGGKTMQALQDRILHEGKNLGGGILKVDGFINHQVDPVLMNACGEELAHRFESVGATRVLTAEISGIAPAIMTARYLRLPVVYARKSKPITMPDTVYLTVAPSHTKGRMVELIVSPEYLLPGEKVLIIDDFLASGATILGLARLTKAAGATLVGIGTLIEKTFEGGRDALAQLGVPIEALVSITSMDNGQICFKK